PEISQPIYVWGEVADQVWVLVGYGDAANPTVVEEGIVITASFSSTEGQVSGSSGCNNYFTGYESTDDGGLTITGPIGATMMACENGMEEEAAYLAALETVTGWTITDEGRLQLTYDTGQPYDEVLVYTPGETPLTGPIWQLVSYGDPDDSQSLIPGTSITAEFVPETETSGTVGGNATCNSYTTGYSIEGDQISFGPVAGTRMMCPVGAEQETAYLTALETAESYEIVGPNMQIIYDGGVLNFTSLNLPLENVLWQALVLNGQPVPPEVEISALFNPGDEANAGTIGGSSGCNSYSAGYEIDTNLLTISGPIAMTRALCPDETLSNLESSYVAALETAKSYDILGNQLVIRTGGGDIIYTADREPLLGTLWSLISLGAIDDPQPPVEGSNFTAQFNRLPTMPSGTMVGETGCNEYNATFTANLNEIKINLPVKTNNADCPWGTGNFEVEQQYFSALNSATEYRILGDILQIPYGEGEDRQVLNFEATEPPAEETVDLAQLNDTFWYLASFDGTPLVSGTEITAGFAVNEDGLTGMVSGSGGCNAYNADVAGGESFAVGPVASTRRACSQSVMDQEGGYFDWLGNAFAFDRAGDQLLISTVHGVLVYNSYPTLDQSLELQNRTWYLVSVGTLQAVPGSNATTFLNVDGSTVSGNTGCNDFNGRYRTGLGNELAISGMTSTRAACPSEALTKQEEALLIFLPSAISYSVSDTSMQIQTVDGSVINYTSIPPVQPAGPTAVIDGPTEADAGQLLTFDGTGSMAGGTPIVSYVWDMGNGTVLSGPTVQHTYNTANAYTYQLTVTDQSGQTSTAAQTVTVRPVAEVTPPTAAIEGPGQAFVGQSVTFSAANSQPGTGAISSYVWQSGDGNNTGPVPENSFSTIYSFPGVYYPSVSVVDANDLSDSASMAITINANLEGTDWILSSSIPGTAVSLKFANGSVGGFAGCNSYSGMYSTTLAEGPTNSISVGPLTTTSAQCSEEIMNQEQAYLASLQTASQYTISGNGLTLTTADGPLEFSASVATVLPVPAQ
ncbi:MAG: META domain-containing protein, partial [Chloroflexota bacterium]